jgi:hypothetical protein
MLWNLARASLCECLQIQRSEDAPTATGSLAIWQAHACGRCLCPCKLQRISIIIRLA